MNTPAGKITFPPEGSLLIATSNAPAILHGRIVFVFFSADDQGVMGWDITTLDDDIMLPVVIRKLRLEAVTEHIPAANRDLLNGGPSTLKPGGEREFFMLHDSRPETDVTHRINDLFSYAVLTRNQYHIQQLEDLRLDRLLIIRGYMGFDAADMAEQLEAGWWRIMPADPSVLFDLAPDQRAATIIARGHQH